MQAPRTIANSHRRLRRRDRLRSPALPAALLAAVVTLALLHGLAEQAQAARSTNRAAPVARPGLRCIAPVVVPATPADEPAPDFFTPFCTHTHCQGGNHAS